MTNFGKALSCTDSLHTGRYVSGVMLVAESLYRRFITREGELIADPLYGLALDEWLGATTSPSEVAALPGLIRQQAMRDERVRTITADVTEVAAGPDREWTVTLDVVTDVGPFQLVMSVSEVTVELLGITT